MARIFISYARSDGLEIAQELVNRLRALKHEVFIDIQGIPGGAEWEKELIWRAKWCDALMLIVTEGSNNSQYVYQEFRASEKINKLIVPIRVNDVRLPNYLSGFNAILLENKNYDNVLLKFETGTFPLIKDRQERVRKAQKVSGVLVTILLIGLIIAIGSLTRQNSQVIISPLSTLNPQWKIAFAATVDGNTDIWVMNSDRNNLKRVTNDSAYDFDPSLSPDGKQIVFASNRDGDFEIYVVGINGNNLQKITDNQFVDGSPVWSPLGDRLAFVSDSSGNDEVYIVDLDGQNAFNVTQNQAGDAAPTWSPDGKQLAFRSNRDGNSEVYITNVDSTEIYRLTNNHEVGYTVSWSPDGKQIAYDSLDENNYNIYTIDIQGTERHQLTNHPANDAEPDWSPDGQFIVFVSERDGNKELFVMTVTGEEPQNITYDINNDFNPSWR